MYKKIQKTLDWGVKIASLAVTAPATWLVASELFSDVQNSILLFAMRFAAVFLIEGVLLSNWLLLEFDRNATSEIKARYGITALAMYVALLVIAWQHEGPTGLVFRIALLAALLGSGWDTYVYTWQKATRKVDNSATNSAKVKRHARRLSIKEAIAQREAEHAITAALMQTELEARQALIQAEHFAALEQNTLYGERLVAGIQLDDKAERIKLMQAAQEIESNGSNGSNGKKKPSLQSAVSYPKNGQKGENVIPVTSHLNTTDLDDQQMTHAIMDVFAEDPSYTMKDVSRKLTIDYRKTRKLIKEAIEDGLLYKENRNYYLSEEAEARVNGGRARRSR